MKYILTFGIATAIFSITGCVSAPKSAKTFDQMVFPKPISGNEILVFYRRVTPPTLYEAHVSIDGMEVASLPTESFSWIELPVGRHKVKVKWTAWSGMPSYRYDVNLIAGGNNYLELDQADNVVPVFDLIVHHTHGVEPEEDQTAAYNEEKKIRKCCRYVPAKSHGAP